MTNKQLEAKESINKQLAQMIAIVNAKEVPEDALWVLRDINNNVWDDIGKLASKE